MKCKLSAAWALLALGMGFAVFTLPAHAGSVEGFYRGKTVELIVGYSAGGGYDRYARLLASHMGRHIPGNPTIVVKNMPGANSLVATNHLFVAVPKDGTVIGTFNRGLATLPLLVDDNTIEYRADWFNWIGSLNNEVNVCVSWHTSAVKTWDDMRKHELVVGAASEAGGSYMYANLLNNAFKTRMKVITGYSGGSEMLLAMERGEINGRCSWSWSSVKSERPDWIRDGKVNILIQLALKKHPDLPDVPLITDIAETDEQRQMLRLLLSRQAMGRPFAAPPGVFEERVKALRDAFKATTEDSEFLADAEKVKLEVDPISGEEVEELLRSVYATPKNVIAMARKAIEE